MGGTIYDESKIFHRKKDNLENLGKLDKIDDSLRRKDFRRKDFLTMDSKGHISTYGRPVLPATTESRDAYNNVMYNGVPVYKKSNEKLSNMPPLSNSYPSYKNNSNYINNFSTNPNNNANNMNTNNVNNSNSPYLSPRSYEYDSNNYNSQPNDQRRNFLLLC
jgi:hypothetical protein